MNIAVLDDYQTVAREMADWNALPPDVRLDIFQDHLADENALAPRLQKYDIIIGMRERTPFRASLLRRLPNLKLLITTGMGNAAFDIDAATQLGIVVSGTSSGGGPGTAELTWGLILSLARSIPQEDRGVREGRWQVTVGLGLAGKTLGVIGFGRIGSQVAKVGVAFGMEVLTWSQNMTPQRAQAVGATAVSKDDLLARSDFVTLHVTLNDRSRGLLGSGDLARMKPTAYLINTSRGPLVDEEALIEALRSKKIAGAGLDVFNVEPLPLDHPLRHLPNTVVTPHKGYVTEEGYRGMYTHTVENIQTFLKGQPVRVLNPVVLERANRRGMV